MIVAVHLHEDPDDPMVGKVGQSQSPQQAVQDHFGQVQYLEGDAQHQPELVPGLVGRVEAEVTFSVLPWTFFFGRVTVFQGRIHCIHINLWLVWGGRSQDPAGPRRRNRPVEFPRPL